MQDRDPDRQYRRRAVGVQGLDLPELVRHLRDGLGKLREALGQVQVPAQPDAVHALAQQRAAHVQPVVEGVLFRVSAFHEGGQPAQADREQVGVEAQLVHRHVGAGA